MIVSAKPLKIKLKETQNPLEDFKFINRDNHYSSTKEVLFVRYIGIPNSTELYIESILELDRHFTANMSASPYLRLHKLEILSDFDDIARLSKVWESWQGIIDQPESLSLYQTPLGSPLKNDTLEWSKKLAFRQIVSLYKKIQPNSNETFFKNFVIKFLGWMEIYLPKLFYPHADTDLTPKVVFIGDIKQHELLFLYFLSRLGCDICYMNPKEDIVHLYPEAKEYSTLHKCGALYADHVTIPDFSPPPKVEQTSRSSKPDTVFPSKILTAAKPSPTLNPSTLEELTYEQLAALSSSVVMIKTYDNDNEILCGGSGVVIHSSGYILTNLHVVAGGNYFSVLYENETQEYLTDNFVKYHQEYDLAVIKVDNRCSPLPVKAEGNLVRGQKIVAIGSPLGLFNSVSDGIVSGFRDINTIPMIQFTAPISHGSSGGALLDMFGRLVGLLTAGFDQGQNLNLAVPSQIIYQFAQNFIET